MKKFLILLVVLTAVFGAATEARAGLNLYVNLGGPVRHYRSYSECDYGYSRPSVRYYSGSRYNRPRYRQYYSAPVYYRSNYRTSSRYSSYGRGCRY